MEGWISLRGHRDDATNTDKTHQGEFKNLLDFRIDAGDIALKEHLETSRRMLYTFLKLLKISY